MRTWRTPKGAGIVLEGTQTGDGRVIADGAVTHAPLPLPFAWMKDGTQHVDLSAVAPQVGTIETLTRNDDGSWSATGTLDDGNPDGAELARRMDSAMASHGAREFVSIDSDNWALQIIATDGVEDDGGVLVAASSIGSLPHTFALWDKAAVLEAVGLRRPLVAAAGDPDPGMNGGEKGALLFEDSVDSILLRFTRMRVRGVTAVPTPAFDGAFIELDPATVEAAVDVDGEEVEPHEYVDEDGDGTCDVCGVAEDEHDAAQEAEPAQEASTRSPLVAHGAPTLLRGLLVPDRPSIDVFDEPGPPNGSLNIDDYRVSGYVAVWDSCHNGEATYCIPPPREDAGYGMFRHGQGVECEGGEVMRVGVFTWGIPHADLDDDLLRAQSHYADARHGFAQVVVGANEHGIWHAGTLRPACAVAPAITRDDVRVLKALSMSGDWRWDPRDRGLRLIAGLAVNFPGFHVPRASVTASANARRAAHVMVDSAEAYHDGERVTALVAAGMVRPFASADAADHSDCGCDTGARLARMERTLGVLDQRTRHLTPAAIHAAAARISN